MPARSQGCRKTHFEIFNRMSFCELKIGARYESLAFNDRMLEWNPDYETGVPEIDTQHKVLFDNINRLGKLLGKEEIEQAEADSVLDFLQQYVVQHFQHEENCMARFHCPAHAKNKEQHIQLLNALMHFNEDYATAGLMKDKLQRLHMTLVWWINSHILKVDIQLKDCVQSKAPAG